MGGSYKTKGRNYFPSHAPTWFSYTEDFAQGGRYKKPGMIKVAGIASKKLTGSRMDYHRGVLDNPEVIDHLKALAASAKASELAFLNKYGIKNFGNDWGGLIKTFTLLYSDRGAFERNLQLLTQVNNKEDTIYHYFVTHYGSYLRQAVEELVPQSGLAKGTTSIDAGMKKLMYDIIELSLVKMFNMRDAKTSNGRLETNWRNRDKLINSNQATEVKTLQNMLKMIQSFKNNDFLSGLNEVWDLENLVLDMINGTKNAKTSFIYDVHSSGKKGTIAEYFEHVFANEVNTQLNNIVIGNGGPLWMTFGAKANGKESGVKADVTQFRGDAKAAAALKIIDNTGPENSKRVNAIRKYKDWFEKFGNAKSEIVFISDKNYQINSKFNGFAAQTKVKLNNLSALFEEIGTLRGADIRSLIDFLANCGSNMLLGDRSNEIMDTIATQIGNFLFDDLEITGSPDVSRVHILSLSGFYVPLSVYFEGLIRAITETREEMSGFVNVNFHSAGPAGAASPWEGEEDFWTFRNIQLEDSYIDVHFMRNFAQFITSHVTF